MSWIVESLLNKRDEIREKGDIESDEFNDLIIIERAIGELKRQGLLSPSDMKIIEEFNMGLSEVVPHMASKSLSKKRIDVCDRIAYYLGGYFTDEGYLDYMRRKYNLSEESIDILWKFIRSKYKHKVMRNPIYGKPDNE